MDFLFNFASFMMKVFTFIFSLYILVLIAIPCVDRPFENTLHPTEHAGQASHDHGAGSDHCSPFCDCNCCGMQVLSMEAIVLPEVVSVTGKVVFWYPTRFISEPHRSIWLPPELA
jgi:hypothetical protein